jgi:hypothetical protein
MNWSTREMLCTIKSEAFSFEVLTLNSNRLPTNSSNSRDSKNMLDDHRFLQARTRTSRSKALMQMNMKTRLATDSRMDYL